MTKPSLIVLAALSLLAPPLMANPGGIESLQETGKAFSAVAKKISPSVVSVQIESRTVPQVGMNHRGMPRDWPFNDEMFRRFFGDQFGQQHRGFSHPQAPRGRSMPGRALGSGFVFSIDKGLIHDKAYILTNRHVVENADKIRVKFQDGREFDAKVKGADPHSDIAVLEVDAKDLPALKLGDSNKLEQGEWVIALGNPFGLSHTLTVGVVSAKGRTSVGLSDYEDFIQTDAAINPGNSGGPLVNLNGEVVGINTAIFSRSGGSMGIGFAIPVNLARSIAEQLLQNGAVTRGYLGVYIQNLTPELADSLELQGRRGILISKVNPGTPAEKSGLKQGDVVISYQGSEVEEVGDFRNKVALTLPGTKAKLVLIRDGKKREQEVTIGQLEEDKVAGKGSTENADQLGLTVQTLTPELAENFKVESGKGVVVTQVEPGSVANMAGIRPGTLILEVNRQPVNSARAFARAINASGNQRALLLLQRDGMTQFVVLSW